MAKLVINSYEEFASHLGEKLGESEWLQIDQDRINKFADATLDPQWIHVDVERAKVESPYHSTIAHGCKTSIKFTIEIEGQRKPALSGIAQFLYYFEN